MDIRDNNVLIWDVDGVLIYVRESYRKTIVETVQYYFSELIGLEFGEHLMTIADTQKFKLVEGFNDDWRVTYACVLCFLAKLVSGLDKDALTAQMNGDVQGLEGKLKRLKVLGTHGSRAGLGRRAAACRLRRRPFPKCFPLFLWQKNSGSQTS